MKMNRWTAAMTTLGFAFALMSDMTAQSNNRFPAPLGLDRAVTGTVSKVKPSKEHKSKTNKGQPVYRLSADGNTFNLYGHEKELKRLVGRTVRITGNAVGNELTVKTIARAEK